MPPFAIAVTGANGTLPLWQHALEPRGSDKHAPHGKQETRPISANYAIRRVFHCKMFLS